MWQNRPDVDGMTRKTSGFFLDVSSTVLRCSWTGRRECASVAVWDARASLFSITGCRTVDRRKAVVECR